MISPAITPQGQRALDGLLQHPSHALIGLDFDGTLAPIVPDPRDARPLPEVLPVLTTLAAHVGTLAIITGRPVAEVIRYGGFDAVPGLLILGHYGWQRWQSGDYTNPEPPREALDAVRRELPGLLRAARAADAWVEDKHHAIAVHTRRTADPQGTFERVRVPLTDLAARTGLQVDPGRFVIELRPPGVDKGTALRELVQERNARYVMFVGDDLGDLPAFAIVRALRGEGIAGCAVASGSAETAEVAAAADLVVDGPLGVAELLAAIASDISAESKGGI